LQRGNTSSASIKRFLGTSNLTSLSGNAGLHHKHRGKDKAEPGKSTSRIRLLDLVDRKGGGLPGDIKKQAEGGPREAETKSKKNKASGVEGLGSFSNKNFQPAFNWTADFLRGLVKAEARKHTEPNGRKTIQAREKRERRGGTQKRRKFEGIELTGLKR